VVPGAYHPSKPLLVQLAEHFSRTIFRLSLCFR